MSITVAKFRDVADGIQPGQFMICLLYTSDAADE